MGFALSLSCSWTKPRFGQGKNIADSIHDLERNEPISGMLSVAGAETHLPVSDP